MKSAALLLLLAAIDVKSFIVPPPTHIIVKSNKLNHLKIDQRRSHPFELSQPPQTSLNAHQPEAHKTKEPTHIQVLNKLTNLFPFFVQPRMVWVGGVDLPAH